MVFPAIIYDGKGNASGDHGKRISESNPFPVNNIFNGAVVDVSNPLPVRENSFISADNSTESTLLANIEFIGEWIDILQFSVIVVAVKSNVGSATDGLVVEFGPDGVTVVNDDKYTIPASKGKTFSFQPSGRYMRVRYTNGGVDQTSFSLETQLKSDYVKSSSHRIQDSIIDDDDAELVKAVITGKNPAGTFVNFQATTAGNFKTSIEELENSISSNSNTQLNVTPFSADGVEGGLSKDFYLAVAMGQIAGHSIMSKFGQNDDIGTGAYEDIWDGGGTYNYPADGTAPITKLVGHDAADTEPIEVQGLDIDGVLTIQTKTLTGLTTVTLDIPLWRVFRLKNVGTSDLVGDVCAINDGDTVDYACIDNGNNQTLMTLYTIPVGKTGYLMQGTNSIIGTNRGYSISGKLWMKPFGLVFQLKKTFGLNSDGSGFMVMPFPLPGKIPAKTDIRVSAISSAAGGGLNTTFEILLVDD